MTRESSSRSDGDDSVAFVEPKLESDAVTGSGRSVLWRLMSVPRLLWSLSWERPLCRALLAVLVMSSLSLFISFYLFERDCPTVTVRPTLSMSPGLHTVAWRAVEPLGAEPALAVPDDPGTDPPSTRVELQDWVLSMLRPLAPELLPATTGDLPVQQDGETVYHNEGANYAMHSNSSRLQRLPLLSRWMEFNERKGFRFPSQPTFVPHPVLPSDPAAGDFRFLLSIQLGSYSSTRQVGAKTLYHNGPYKLAVKHIAMTLTVHATATDSTPSASSPHFELRFEHQQELSQAAMLDQRLMPYSNALLAYDNLQGAVLFETVPTGNASMPVAFRALSPRQSLAYQEANGSRQKNYMALVLQDGTVYWITHFAPFTVIDCGTPLKPAACRLFRYQSLARTLAPYKCYMWRGSSPLVPLPDFPHIFLGSVHERIKSPDRYNHRLFLVDSLSLEPMAYTDPFGFFGRWETSNWFEFVVSMQLITVAGVQELLLSFGYNDQEPWLAVLPMHGFIANLQPVTQRFAPQLHAIQQHYSRLSQQQQAQT